MQIYEWDKPGFETAYLKHYYKLKGCGAIHRKSCACTDSTISYGRIFFQDDNIFKLRAENLISKLNLQSGSDVLVIGCALGYLMEELKNKGMNVWGCDNSQYIQTTKNRPGEDVQFPIHNIDVLDSNFVSKITRATGASWFDVVITEDVLTSHDEYATILNHCETMLNPDSPKTNIVHIVDTTTSAPFINKTVEEWKSINTNHTWLNSFGLDQ